MWLEDYLSKWNKILFMVSHSQDFMNTVCTHMVHHTSKKKLVYYSGNYDQFVQTRMEKSEEQEKRFKSEQDQIKHMKDYVARFGQGNAKMARQAQSKEKILDKMLKSGLTDKVEVEKALDFKFPDCGKISPPVLQCNDLSFGALASPVFQTTSRRDPRLIFSTLSLSAGYPGCEILYEGVDFGIDLDSRVALVGPNGAGKRYPHSFKPHPSHLLPPLTVLVITVFPAQHAAEDHDRGVAAADRVGAPPRAPAHQQVHAALHRRPRPVHAAARLLHVHLARPHARGRAQVPRALRHLRAGADAGDGAPVGRAEEPRGAGQDGQGDAAPAAAR